MVVVSRKNEKLKKRTTFEAYNLANFQTRFTRFSNAKHQSKANFTRQTDSAKLQLYSKIVVASLRLWDWQCYSWIFYATSNFLLASTRTMLQVIFRKVIRIVGYKLIIGKSFFFVLLGILCNKLHVTNIVKSCKLALECFSQSV